MTLWPGLQNLPREARDTLFLLAVIAWIVAPQADHLPLWCVGMAAGLLVWRGYVAVRGLALPSRWWLTGLMLLAMAATFFTHRTLMGRDAGLTFIVVLLSLKTLEMRAKRDAFVIFFLSFFTLLSNFFFSQSLPIAASMLLGLLGLLTALVNSHMPVGRPPLLQAAKTAGWMALLGAPIMVVLFVLFPRVAPLWGMPSDTMAGRSGLSNTMQVGTIASLALDDSVAFRVRFDGAVPDLSDLYFRGPVLSSFDGREWRSLRSNLAPVVRLEADLTTRGPAYPYTVTLQATSRPWLLTLDATPQKPELPGIDARMTPELQWIADRPITDLIRYKAVAYSQFSHGPMERASGLQDYLNLPFNSNPRTQQLAGQIRQDPRNAGATTAGLVKAVLQRLRTGGYSYTLEPGLYGSQTADEFWFDRKQGFCEHIASSFVVLMRHMNIPARLVTGYQGGNLNAVDGFWIIRQSDAHAWAEVWMEGKGWVRVDPTASVSPDRTGSFTRLQAPRSAIATALNNVSPQFSVNLRSLWEAANNGWNQWVLNYTQSRQMNLLRNLGFESPSWEDLSYLLIGVVVAASLVGAAWTQWEKHRQDPWLYLLQRAAQRMRRAGLGVSDTTPPRQMAAMLRSVVDPKGRNFQDANDWLLAMEAWRYAPRPAASQLATLQRRFPQLLWPQRPP